MTDSANPTVAQDMKGELDKVYQDNSTQEVIHQVYLKRGDYTLESWLETDKGTLGPFYVNVTKR